MNSGPALPNSCIIKSAAYEPVIIAIRTRAVAPSSMSYMCNYDPKKQPTPPVLVYYHGNIHRKHMGSRTGSDKGRLHTTSCLEWQIVWQIFWAIITTFGKRVEKPFRQTTCGSCKILVLCAIYFNYYWRFYEMLSVTIPHWTQRRYVSQLTLGVYQSS